MKKAKEVPHTIEQWFKRLEPRAGAFVRDVILGEPQDVMIVDFIEPDIELAMKAAAAKTVAEMKDRTDQTKLEWSLIGTVGVEAGFAFGVAVGLRLRSFSGGAR